MKWICLFLAFGLNLPFSNAQSVQLLTSGQKISMRGLSVPNDQTIWVCGNNGQIGRSVDAGTTWKWSVIKGYEKTEFRDIEAFDDQTAIVMGIADPSYILRTTDAGENWTLVFSDSTKGMFLDAMEFWNNREGIVLGDPIGGRFYLARTTDGGISWQTEPLAHRPLADSGEACFASSGTNIRSVTKNKTVFVTGGLVSNLHTANKKIRLPLTDGKESTGANSIAIKNEKMFITVGGDFNEKDNPKSNCSITHNAGKSWISSITPPLGYRSCIEYLKGKSWVTCGLNGVDLSVDDGLNFKSISKVGYHVCRKSKNGDAVYFAGGGGRIAKLVL